ncbi:hypothetical protein ACWCXH_15480 [Kitasatospora sp. NPDC001660]
MKAAAPLMGVAVRLSGELAPVRKVGQQVGFSLFNVYKLIRKSRVQLRNMRC